MTIEKWTRTKVLVLGTTYPSYSRKYTEIVCTGGIRETDCRMVRLHPIPHRYLAEDQQFGKFQWISVDLTPHDKDPRPDSFRVKAGSIEPGDRIPASRPEDRTYFLDNSPHRVQSVEALKERFRREHISLGIVRPKEIIDCEVEERTERERREWHEREVEVLAQKPLFGEQKSLDFPDLRFIVSWWCDDRRCIKPHRMSLLQWGLHELSRRYRGRSDRKQKILAAMRKELDQDKNDVYLFLGSYRGLQYNFGLMDSYSAPRTRQAELFVPGEVGER